MADTSNPNSHREEECRQTRAELDSVNKPSRELIKEVNACSEDGFDKWYYSNQAIRQPSQPNLTEQEAIQANCAAAAQEFVTLKQNRQPSSRRLEETLDTCEKEGAFTKPVPPRQEECEQAHTYIAIAKEDHRAITPQRQAEANACTKEGYPESFFYDFQIRQPSDRSGSGCTVLTNCSEQQIIKENCENAERGKLIHEEDGKPLPATISKTLAACKRAESKGR